MIACAGINGGLSFPCHGQSLQRIGDPANVKNYQLGFLGLSDCDVRDYPTNHQPDHRNHLPFRGYFRVADNTPGIAVAVGNGRRSNSGLGLSIRMTRPAYQQGDGWRTKPNRVPHFQR